MPRTLLVASGTAAAFVCAPVVTSTQPSESKAHVMVTPSTVTWGPGPAALPAGTQAAVLEGDPAKAGPFNLRLKMPDGYKIAPHYHPADEHVTGSSGHVRDGHGREIRSDRRSRADGRFLRHDADGNPSFRLDEGRDHPSASRNRTVGCDLCQPQRRSTKKPSE